MKHSFYMRHPSLALAAVVLTSFCAAQGPSEPESVMSAIPIAAQARASVTVGRDEPAFYSHIEKQGVRLENLQQGLSASFTVKGADFQQGSNHWTIALSAYGHGSK